MATTKGTTSKKATSTPTTKKTTKTAAATTTTTTDTVKSLQKEIGSLREEVATLRTQVKSLASSTGTGETTSTTKISDNPSWQLQQKVIKIFRAIGVREWQLTDAGLK